MKHKLIQTHANISCSSNNESIKQLANISSSTTLDTSLSLSLILQGVFLLSASVKFLKIIRFQKCLPNLHIFKHFWLSCIIGILLMQILKKLPVDELLIFIHWLKIVKIQVLTWAELRVCLLSDEDMTCGPETWAQPTNKYKWTLSN